MNINYDKEVLHYKQQLDELAGENIKQDYQISALRSELRQRRQGFSLLTNLQKSLSISMTLDEILRIVTNDIPPALGMDKAITLSSTNSGSFIPKFWFGFHANEVMNTSETLIHDEYNSCLLVNGTTKSTEFITTLREKYFLPFFIAIPLDVAGERVAWIFTGRNRESKPFNLPLNDGDVDSLKAIANFISSLMVNKQSVEETIKYERQIAETQKENDVTERILHNILPQEIATRIRHGDQKIIDTYKSVSVLFADIAGFTKLSQHITPEQLVEILDSIFNIFDHLADKHGCEKIKTIGDCYMVVAGLPEQCDNHASRLAAMALDMQNAIENLPAIVENVKITMRFGLHSGRVVAGIIGKNKYAYDLWGDAVNTASRMESHGEVNRIHVSEDFSICAGKQFNFTERGEMEIKGKGTMKTYFLISKNQN